MSESQTKRIRLENFYPTIIDVIYGLLLTGSFPIAISLSFPIIESESFDTNQLINILGLLLFYIIILPSWIGHRKSLIERPYRNVGGNSRFVIDIIILFFFAYILNLTKPENIQDSITNFTLPNIAQGDSITYFAFFGEGFRWGFPIIFGLFLLWDIIKYYEYKYDKTNPANFRRVLLTIIFLSLFIIQAVIWSKLNDRINHDYIIYLGYILASIFMILLFRYMKWYDEVEHINNTIKEIINNKKIVYDNNIEIDYLILFLKPHGFKQLIGLTRNALCFIGNYMLIFCPYRTDHFTFHQHFVIYKYEFFKVGENTFTICIGKPLSSEQEKPTSSDKNSYYVTNFTNYKDCDKEPKDNNKCFTQNDDTIKYIYNYIANMTPENTLKLKNILDGNKKQKDSKSIQVLLKDIVDETEIKSLMLKK